MRIHDKQFIKENVHEQKYLPLKNLLFDQMNDIKINDIGDWGIPIPVFFLKRTKTSDKENEKYEMKRKIEMEI